MRETDKQKSDRIECPLRDDELDAATGGMFNAFANFGDIKGESTDAAPFRVGISFMRNFRKT